MFYSHEILTSREHGVATIWLVATLGAKSTTRRVNRKAILDVDVPKACDTIMRPEAPMALRLQGNLLYGISRVYNQQCVYTLTDTQAMHDRMRIMLKSVQGTGLDPEAGKARPDHLIVPYDKSFMPDADLPGFYHDLLALGAGTEFLPSPRTSLLSTQGSFSDGHSNLLFDEPQLQISSSDIDIMGLTVPGSVGKMSDSIMVGNQISQTMLSDEEGVLLQPDFEFDEEGNIVELGRHGGNIEGGTQGQSEAASAHQVREGQDHQADAFIHQDEYNETLLGDESLPSDHVPKRGRLADPDYIEETAQMPPKKVARILVVDERNQLRNADLAQSNYGYLENMAAASKQKEQYKNLVQAKKNAAFWVFGQGIASVGVGLGISRVEHPLSCFSGEQLFDIIQGEGFSGRGKRSRGSTEDSESDSDSRRVRRRRDEGELGRGDGFQLGEAAEYKDIEIGRQGPPSLQDDHSSQMPWNLTSSIHGSRHGSSAPSLPRGFGSASEIARGHIGFGRAGSRLTSASPLAGRGLGLDLAGQDILSSLPIPGNEGGDIDVLGDFDLDTYLEGEMDDRRPVTTTGGHDSFQLFGPAAAVDTQTAEQSQWIASALDHESKNFFEFVKNKIDTLVVEQSMVREQGNGLGEGSTHEVTGSREIAFSVLLPPEMNSRVVATQGLMHVLTLATKGIMSVRQAESAPSYHSHGQDEPQSMIGDIFLSVKETQDF
ncbi:hypothetical protein DTO271G3_6284 [Paecilomyces variotii]|nr:hypothetical protein DTO271G3_6284 [Paecilomyces variotii]